MTLTKAQIVEAIQYQTGFPKNKSSEIVETLLEIINQLRWAFLELFLEVFIIGLYYNGLKKVLGKIEG